MTNYPTMGEAIAAGEKLADSLPPGWTLKLGFVEGKGWSWTKVGPPMTADDWAAEEDAISRAEFERELKKSSPCDLDPYHWALYNQRVDRLRTERRIKKETKSCE